MTIGDFLALLPQRPAWVPVDWLTFSFLVWLAAVWVARLSLKHPPHKKAVAGWLRHPRYTQLYRWACRPVVEWFWQRVGDTSVKETEPSLTQAKGTLTAKLYDKALLIAVIYPIFIAVGYWLWTGNAATIGSAEIVGAEPSLKRLFTLGPIAILVFFVCLKIQILSIWQKYGMPLNDWRVSIFDSLELIGLVFAGAVAFALTGALSIAVSFVYAFLSAVVIALTVAIVSHRKYSEDDAPGGALLLATVVIFAVAILSAVAGAYAFSGTGAGAIVVPAVGTIVLSGASSLAFAGAVAVVGAIAGADVRALAGAVTVAFAFEFARRKIGPRAFNALHALCLCTLIYGSVRYFPWPAISDDRKSIFVFLGVFPLINGVFDWISYGVTLSLLRRGQWAAWPFLWGLLDLIVACVLFLLLGVTLVAVLHGLDQLAGGELVDLPGLLGGVYALKDGNWSQSWALFMVFSTMLPTGLHVLISLIGLQGLWPAPWRRKLAGWIEVDAPSPLSQALLPMVLGVVWAAPIVAGCAVIWALIEWGKPLLGGFFQGYFNLLMWVAQWGGVV